MYVNGKKFAKSGFYNRTGDLTGPTHGPFLIWIV